MYTRHLKRAGAPSDHDGPRVGPGDGGHHGVLPVVQPQTGPVAALASHLVHNHHRVVRSGSLGRGLGDSDVEVARDDRHDAGLGLVCARGDVDPGAGQQLAEEGRTWDARRRVARQHEMGVGVRVNPRHRPKR